MKFGIWNSMTARLPNVKILKLKMANGRHLKKSFFGHNSAADCPILVKFCVGKQFSTEFLEWELFFWLF